MIRYFLSATVAGLIGWAVIFWALSHVGRSEPFSLTLGSDIDHAPGLSSWSVRYGDSWGLRAGAIVMPETKMRGVKVTEPVWLVGVDHRWTFGNWKPGLGVVRISDTTKLNGTRLNFDLSLAYVIGGGAFLEFRHYSHGSMFGIKEDKSNQGWNFIGIGFEWR